MQTPEEFKGQLKDLPKKPRVLKKKEEQKEEQKIVSPAKKVTKVKIVDTYKQFQKQVGQQIKQLKQSNSSLKKSQGTDKQLHIEEIKKTLVLFKDHVQSYQF